MPPTVARRERADEHAFVHGLEQAGEGSAALVVAGAAARGSPKPIIGSPGGVTPARARTLRPITGLTAVR